MAQFSTGINNLRTAESNGASEIERIASTWIHKALDDGWVWIGRTPVHSIAFFQGLVAIMAALQRPVKWRGPEMAEIGLRRDLIARACSLLAEWPKCFIDAATDRGWTAVDLTASRKDQPYWLASVVRERLYLGRAKISEGEAKAILSQTYAQTGDQSFMRARSLSGRMVEWHHVQSKEERSISDDTFATFLAHIDHCISRESNIQKRHQFFADKVMFAMARVLGLSQPQLAAITVSEAEAMSSKAVPNFWDTPTSASQIAAWLGWYLRSIRPTLSLSSQSNSLFVGHTPGRGLGKNAIAARFGRHCRDGLLQREIGGFDRLLRIE